MSSTPVPAALAGLTERQRQVVVLAAEGLGNALIARRLNLSEATVKVHLKAAFRTLGVTRRSRLVSLVGAVKVCQPGAEPTEIAVPASSLRIAELISMGRTNDQIAAEIGMSTATAKAMVRSLIDRLGLANRTEVANWYLARTGRLRGAANENVPSLSELVATDGPAEAIALRLGITTAVLADRLLGMLRTARAA